MAKMWKNASKNAFGSKSAIDTAKESGLIDEYDIIYLDNGEIAWLDKGKNTVVNTPRTQEDIIISCVDNFDEADGNKIVSGKTLEEAVKIVAQSVLPKVKEETLQSAKDYTDTVAGSGVYVVEF